MEEGFRRAYESGEGFLCGLQAQTELGKAKEISCIRSELTMSGDAWYGTPRCPSQILNSCDDCKSYVPPFMFYIPVKGKDDEF
jgi:hypothetical protein